MAARLARCIMPAAFVMLAMILAAAAVAQPLPPFPRPCGIYAIGQQSAAGIRAYPFVDGFVMRVDWSQLEPQRDAYDFSAIDAVVHRLDSLGLGLTLDVFRMRVPAYILDEPGAQTHLLQLGASSVLTAVPWDAFALERFEALHAALASHRIRSLVHGDAVPLAGHPVLRQIDATPIGTNGIRDLNHSLTTHPSYTREGFIRAVVRTAGIVRAHFPATMCFVAIFGMRDSIAAPVLTDAVRDSLLTGVMGDPARPMLGFFQENLACNGPLAQPSNPLYAARTATFTMYQMLQAWRAPFADSSKTEACRTDSTGPDVAMRKALETVNATYFELYAADLDYPGYARMFTAMHDTLAALCASTSSVEQPVAVAAPSAPILEAVYPEPFATAATLVYSIGQVGGESCIPVTVVVFDLLGRIATAPLRAHARPGRNTLPIDGSPIPPGTYIIRVTAGAASAYRRMLLAR